MGHPVTGEHKYRDLVLQVWVGGKADGLVLQKTVAKFKVVKPGVKSDKLF
jgi:hypothetical protein